MSGPDDIATRQAASAADLMAAVFADMVTDIRRRVVEEGYFGQVQDGPTARLAEWNPGDGGANHAPADYDPFDPWGWYGEADPPATEAVLEQPAITDGFDR